MLKSVTSSLKSGTGLIDFETARNIKMGGYLESFLVAAVVAVLAIRAFLALTGFPQIAGGGLHIAHILWGGLLMLVAIVLVLSCLGHGVKNLAAILGGLGFGTFIDELGKIITSDNNYFFRPTVALIYVTFVLLFIFFRAIERRRKMGKQELLINAADMMVNALLEGANREEIARILHLLDRSGAEGVAADSVRRVMLSITPVEELPSLPARAIAFSHRIFDRLVSWIWFQRAIVVVFMAHAIGFVASAVVLAGDIGPFSLLANGNVSLAVPGNLISSVVSSGMVIIGIVRLPISRLSAYRWFKRAILVSIFLVQVFAFYESQLSALIGLTLDLVLLAGLNQMLHVEYARREAEGSEEKRQGPTSMEKRGTVSPGEYPINVEGSSAG